MCPSSLQEKAAESKRKRGNCTCIHETFLGILKFALFSDALADPLYKQRREKKEKERHIFAPSITPFNCSLPRDNLPSAQSTLGKKITVGNFKMNLLFIGRLVDAGFELDFGPRGHFLVRQTEQHVLPSSSDHSGAEMEALPEVVVTMPPNAVDRATFVLSLPRRAEYEPSVAGRHTSMLVGLLSPSRQLVTGKTASHSTRDTVPGHSAQVSRLRCC